MIVTKTQEYLDRFIKNIRDSEYIIEGELKEQETFFNDLFERLKRIKSNQSQIFFIGNGASNSMASHFATDFTKNGLIRSIAFTDGSLLTCYSNDYSFEDSFKEMLNCLFKKEDGLIAVSSSGNSLNIVNACKFIRRKYPDSPVLTLSGFGYDNKLRSTCTHNIFVPGDTYGTVESAHSYFLHLILDMFIEKTKAVS